MASIQEVLRKEEGSLITGPERQVWVKYPIAPGIEIHVSRDSEEKERRNIADIIRIARSILNAGGENNE